MVVRTYTETYDLNTAIDELNILAIHTPQAGALKKMFKGHFINYRKYKILGCDINIACAQQLPLSPELVGLEAGQVDPRDVMNPMLFKACTGENLNMLLNQIYNQTQEVQAGSSVGQHIDYDNPALNSYYQFLADGSFRKALPQQGLRIRNLKPFVHKVVTTQPFKYNGFNNAHPSSSDGYLGVPTGPWVGGSSPNVTSALGGFGSPAGGDAGTVVDKTNPSVFVSAGVQSMPWLDTAVPQTIDVSTGESTTTSSCHWIIQNVPRVYCGCIIMPPAKTTMFFMRCAIRWRIAFKDYRPAYELGNMDSLDIIDSDNGINGASGNGAYWTTYWDLYHDAEANSSKMESMAKEHQFFEESSITTVGSESVNMVNAQPF